MEIDTKRGMQPSHCDSVVINMPQTAPPGLQCGFDAESDAVLDGVAATYAGAYREQLYHNGKLLELHSVVQVLTEDLNKEKQANAQLASLNRELQDDTAKWKKEVSRFRTYLQAIMDVGMWTSTMLLVWCVQFMAYVA